MAHRRICDREALGTRALKVFIQLHALLERISRIAVWIGGAALMICAFMVTGDVILRKFQRFRDAGAARHLEDIRAMLRVSGDAVDQNALTGWIRRLDLDETWARMTQP